MPLPVICSERSHGRKKLQVKKYDYNYSDRHCDYHMTHDFSSKKNKNNADVIFAVVYTKQACSPMAGGYYLQAEGSL